MSNASPFGTSPSDNYFSPSPRASARGLAPDPAHDNHKANKKLPWKPSKIRGVTPPVLVITAGVALLFIFTAVGLPLLMMSRDESGDEKVIKCGEDPEMEGHRNDVLRLHNEYRSRVAQGKYTIEATSSKIKVLPTATRMIQLKYNCSLEKTSKMWAKKSQCMMRHSKTPSLGENLYSRWPVQDHAEALRDATTLWADEIKKFGVQTLSDWTHDIGHATQIFWANTATLGCGIAECSDTTMVVCQYYPQGNLMGYDWYRAGKILSECGKNGRKEVAHFDTGLCELKT